MQSNPCWTPYGLKTRQHIRPHNTTCTLNSHKHSVHSNCTRTQHPEDPAAAHLHPAILFTQTERFSSKHAIIHPQPVGRRRRARGQARPSIHLLTMHALVSCCSTTMSSEQLHAVSPKYACYSCCCYGRLATACRCCCLCSFGTGSCLGMPAMYRPVPGCCVLVLHHGNQKSIPLAALSAAC